ncbi:hypothetical protein Tco_0075978 [Tanacetum coccineum]
MNSNGKILESQCKLLGKRQDQEVRFSLNGYVFFLVSTISLVKNGYKDIMPCKLTYDSEYGSVIDEVQYYDSILFTTGYDHDIDRYG